MEYIKIPHFRVVHLCIKAFFELCEAGIDNCPLLLIIEQSNIKLHRANLKPRDGIPLKWILKAFLKPYKLNVNTFRPRVPYLQNNLRSNTWEKNSWLSMIFYPNMLKQWVATLLTKNKKNKIKSLFHCVHKIAFYQSRKQYEIGNERYLSCGNDWAAW